MHANSSVWRTHPWLGFEHLTKQESKAFTIDDNWPVWPTRSSRSCACGWRHRECEQPTTGLSWRGRTRQGSVTAIHPKIRVSKRGIPGISGPVQKAPSRWRLCQSPGVARRGLQQLSSRGFLLKRTTLLQVLGWWGRGTVWATGAPIVTRTDIDDIVPLSTHPRMAW